MADHDAPDPSPSLTLKRGEDPVKGMEKFLTFMKENGATDEDISRERSYFHQWEKSDADEVCFTIRNVGDRVQIEAVEVRGTQRVELTNNVIIKIPETKK